MVNNKDEVRGLKQGQKIAFIATVATLLLAVFKGLIGFLFDSVILVADAFHSGADLLAIFASFFGLWLASKKKSARFPYGLYKAETLASFIIGCLIAWAGVELLKDGYYKLFYNVQVQEFPFWPVFVSIISIIVSFFIAKKEKEIGRGINSQSLLANAADAFLNIFTSVVVLSGILLNYFEIPYIEGSVIILISLLIIRLGLSNIRISLLCLLDANLDPQLQFEIEETVNKIYGVKGVGEVRIRQTGPFKMVECKIATNPSLPLYRAHELADKIENFITKNYEHIESVFIHVERLKEKIIYAIIPVKEINGLDSKVYGHFGRAPFFVILKLSDEDIEIEDFYYNKFLSEKKHIGVKVIKAVIKYKPDLLFTSRIGEISFYMLKENYVDVYRIEEGLTVREVIERYRNNRAKQITAPTHSVEESQVEK